MGRYIFNCFVDLIKYLIKWKFKVSFNKVCLYYFLTLIAVCGGFWAIDWSISRNAQGVTQWSLSNSDIGKHQIIVVIIVSLIFLAYLFFNDRKEIRQMLIAQKPLTPEQTNALKSIYDALQNELEVIDCYTLNIMSRGGVSWFTNKQVVIGLPATIKNLQKIVNEQRAFIDDNLYCALMDHANQSLELSDNFWLLAATIGSAEDQDAMTYVIDITYEQDIKMSIDFVKMMMSEFNKVDNHYIYNEYGKMYEKQIETGQTLIKEIKAKLEIDQ